MPFCSFWMNCQKEKLIVFSQCSFSGEYILDSSEISFSEHTILRIHYLDLSFKNSVKKNHTWEKGGKGDGWEEETQGDGRGREKEGG